MKHRYFDSYFVELDPHAIERGGSFTKAGAYGVGSLRRVYDYLAALDKPVLIDVGANSGSYALLATLIPDLTVYAFEPVEESLRLLEKHVKMNGLQDRVEVYSWAVGDRNGIADLYTVSPDASSALSQVGGTPADHKVTTRTAIQMRTLDRVCRMLNIHPSLIKIDTEGSEFLVLQGAINTLEADAPALAVELNWENMNQYGHRAEQVIEFLSTLGYSVSSLTDGDFWATKGTP